MAEPANPEISQGSTKSPTVAVSSDAQKASNPEISVAMLDVHAPHRSVHTWRDFCIHIATISVGLLIAIGLEQTVEAIRHHSERQQLIAHMRDEAWQNLSSAQRAFDTYSARATWLRASVETVRHATPSDGVLEVTLPAAPPFPTAAAPLLPVWLVAKTNGKVALLPEERAEVYERLSHEADMLADAKDRWRKAQLDLTAAGLRLGTVLEPGATLRLTVTDRDILIQGLTLALATQNEVISWNAVWAGACDAVANDAASLEAVTPYLQRHIAALPSQY
jgi:hypothetical protein